MLILDVARVALGQEWTSHNHAVADPNLQNALAAQYDALWEEAAPLVRTGRVIRDPWLSLPTADTRRGVTLLARPATAVTVPLSSFLEQLRSLEPEQRYQPASDLHHTVLSLFTATPDYAAYMTHLPAYRDAVSEVAAGTPPFMIEVRGVTLTKGAVLAQGFPRGDILAALRDRLRAALKARGLGDALDQRYSLVTAHMTLVRFATPLREPTLFVNALAAARQADFGSTKVERLELVFGDWFHTAAHEQLIAQFHLN